MKNVEFKFLEQLKKRGEILLYPNSDYALEIYKANIPYRPGVYLVYALDEKGEDDKLLYYGKAGVTRHLKAKLPISLMNSGFNLCLMKAYHLKNNGLN